MSAHGFADDPTLAPTTPAPRDATPKKIMKGVAAVAAIGLVAFGANAVVGSTNDSATTSTAAPQAQAPAPAASGSQAVPGTTPPAGAPQGSAPPGFGTEVTGATLTKLSAVATAKVPGDVERAMQLEDGSYVVHVIRSDGSGEVHVLVSKAFKVTGTQTGGPGGGPPPGAGGQAPQQGQAAPQGQVPAASGSGSTSES